MTDKDLINLFIEIGGNTNLYSPTIKDLSNNTCIVQLNYFSELIPLSEDFLNSFTTIIKKNFKNIYTIEFIYGNLIYRCNKYSMLD